MTVLYKSLLRLYPREHRRVFAGEMLDVFREAQADASDRSIGSCMVFYLREIAGLVGGATHERLRNLHASGDCKLKFGGSMNHQPRCQFPRFAILMMTIIFVLVLEIIAKGEGLSHYLFRLSAVGGPPLLPGQERWNLGNSIQHWPSHYGLISGVAMGFMIAWVVGVVAWAFAYLLRRTSAQHFHQTQSWPLNQ